MYVCIKNTLNICLYFSMYIIIYVCIFILIKIYTYMFLYEYINMVYICNFELRIYIYRIPTHIYTYKCVPTHPSLNISILNLY